MRVNVYTSKGFDAGKTQQFANQHSVLATRGYMQDPEDWKNVEITGHVKLVHTDSTDAFTWYSRGGRHSDPKPWCEGSSLKVDLYSDGTTKMAKEHWHVSYAIRPAKNTLNIGSIVGKWVGWKAVMYNKVVDGKTIVVMEGWVDKNVTNTWELAHTEIDSGGWKSADTDTVCGGAPDQQVVWGGPIVTFRSDVFDDVDIRYWSVREIDVEGTPDVPPPPPPAPHCAS